MAVITQMWKNLARLYTQMLRVANSVCASVHIKHGNCCVKKSDSSLLEEIKEAMHCQSVKDINKVLAITYSDTI